MSYTLVSQEDFTPEQKQHFQSEADKLIASFYDQDVICIIKDIHSRYLLGSDYYANRVGFSRGEDVEGIFDSELPCKVAEFAQDFVNEDKNVLSSKNHHQGKSMLCILEYATGLESFISYKHQIAHHPSQSILGVKSIAYKVNLSSFFELMPNYLLEFGKVGNLEKTNGKLRIADTHLTEYEYEICFLVAINFSYKQIANFMNRYRPRNTLRTVDTMYKCRDRICEKLKFERWNFRDALIGMNFHRKVPDSFFHRLIGNRPLVS